MDLTRFETSELHWMLNRAASNREAARIMGTGRGGLWHRVWKRLNSEIQRRGEPDVW